MSRHAKAYALSANALLVIQKAVPEISGAVINQINLWLAKSGPEWTAKRLKSLRTAALQLRSDNPHLAVEIYQQESIAYRKSTLLPRGIYGSLLRLFLQAQRPAQLRRIEAVLRAYTDIVLQDITPTQYEKAKTAINSPYQGADTELQKWSDVFHEVGQNLLFGLYTKDYGYLLTYPGMRPKLRNRNLSRLKPYSGTHRNMDLEHVPDGLDDVPYAKAALSMLTTTCWPRAFRSDDSEQVFDFIRSLVWLDSTDNDYAGHIAFIQERGAKLRVVAVPTALLQWGFEPLHDWLDKVLHTLPSSCVHDQNAGAWFLHQALREDREVFCFDLSSATDRFPLSLQTSLLRGMHLEKYADALEELTQEEWLVTQGPDKGKAWKYEVGQPMGLYSSFPLFTLSHIMLLNMLWRPDNFLVWWDPKAPFRVLGDDVIITDRELAAKYSQVLSELGVPFSQTKSMHSFRSGEFAGFVGQRTNKSTCLFRPYKYGDWKYHNPIGLLYALGSRLKSVSPYWERLVIAFQKSRSSRELDLTPLISGSEPGGVMPPVSDTTRMVNLMAAISDDLGIINSYTGEPNELWVLEDFVDILFDKEDSVDAPIRSWEDFLSTPTPKRSEKEDLRSAVDADPLLSELIVEDVQMEPKTVSQDLCLRYFGREELLDLGPEVVPTLCCHTCDSSPCILEERWYDPRPTLT